MPHIVWAAMATGDITYFNQRWYEYSGVDRELPPNSAFHAAIHPDDRVRAIVVWQTAIAQGVPFQLEQRLLAADGTEHWLLFDAVPVATPHGHIQHWVGTCSDVTTHKYANLEACNLDVVALERQVKAQTTELAAADHHQSLFVEALRESEERYRSLVIATAQIVWNTDAEGKITNPMRGWRAYTGQSEAEVQGWGWLDAIHPDDRDRTTQIWTHAVQTGTLYDTEYRVRGADGIYRDFAARGAPIRSEDGSVREWVGFCNDITAHKQAQAALQTRASELAQTTTLLAQTAAILEKRNAELDQFAYVVSHDLKAPLRAIANLSQWLEEDLNEYLTDDTRHQMNLLHGRVHRMENLINGLLQYSRIGRAATQKESTDVAKLLNEIVDDLAVPPAFTITIQPGMPTLYTDRLRLEQVFSNLISNAIKHHDRSDGHIHVTVRPVRASHSGEYEFAVTDDGPGIDPAYHSKVFGIFQTLESRDKVENTGIGLSLVKKIVESQGGTVAIESQVGQGTTLRFTWKAG